jgi:hypothetical protein
VNDVLAWLEATALGHAMRNAGVWSYGLVNLTHIVGVSGLFGSLIVLDLRLLGLWGSTPLPAITTTTVPVAQVGFAVAAASGVCLLVTNATDYVGNPFLLIKFPAIGAGLLNVAVVRRLPEWRALRTRELTAAEKRRLAWAGGISLTCWSTAVAAGRMIGYW